MIAAPSSGQGKTTIATGLIGASAPRAGTGPAPHKVGPDYIDPGYHALAAGRPGRNLDPSWSARSASPRCSLHGRPRAPTSPSIEGVMGLFDGRLAAR